MVTVTLHRDRPRAAIRAWRKTFTGTRWRILRRRPIAVVAASGTDLGAREQAMLAHAELYGGSVTP